VISGQEGRGGFPGKEVVYRRAAFRRVGRQRARAGVERVPVQYEVRHTVEQGSQLREAVDAAGAVTKMQVGEDADERAGHDNGSKILIAPLGRRLFL
jgi:hypothetical protein